VTFSADAKLWDVVVVGTGIGGATAGYVLARGGLSVLFLDRGRDMAGRADQLVGDWAERFFQADGEILPFNTYLQRAGRWTENVLKKSEGNKKLLPTLGQGPGGSSALYGMVLERFFPSDFGPSWPIKLADLAEYYSQAEQLYGVRSGLDPLRPEAEERMVLPPPPFSGRNQVLANHLASKGLHPYHLPMSCNYLPNCRECIGFVCDRRCKVDSATACLMPAIEYYGAAFLDGCEVEKIEATSTSVTSLQCRRDNHLFNVRGKQVLLAAGTLQTPALLLKSKSAFWPKGLANESDQVGRNLMRHFLDYWVVRTGKAREPYPLVKQLAFNDFYVHNGEKLGTIQSNGILPPPRTVARGYTADLIEKFVVLRPLSKVIERAVEHYLQYILPRSLVLASILEDSPSPHNRVEISHEGMLSVSYRVCDYDRRRLQTFRKLIGNALQPYSYLAVHSSEKLKSLGHACGTCRMGPDAATSVVDAVNRAHGLDNLYVVDASFLPTSSGTNPSLTIAANAIRVAEHLLQTNVASATARS
jgi:choline dehydrogenase-like flavoprotein